MSSQKANEKKWAPVVLIDPSSEGDLGYLIGGVDLEDSARAVCSLTALGFPSDKSPYGLRKEENGDIVLSAITCPNNQSLPPILMAKDGDLAGVAMKVSNFIWECWVRQIAHGPDVESPIPIWAFDLESMPRNHWDFYVTFPTHYLQSGASFLKRSGYFTLQLLENRDSVFRMLQASSLRRAEGIFRKGSRSPWDISPRTGESGL